MKPRSTQDRWNETDLLVFMSEADCGVGMREGCVYVRDFAHFLDRAAVLRYGILYH